MYQIVAEIHCSCPQAVYCGRRSVTGDFVDGCEMIMQ
jgi:hypothetical protein